MIANPWFSARMCRRPAAGGGLALALTLVGCAAGDLSSGSDNPFTTNKPGEEETGVPVTDSAVTEPASGTTGGSDSDSNSATNTTPGSATNTTPGTSDTEP
ncbi:MAG: hypothetical protein JNK56_37510, partial [Myxococcales bacterium]|nr:hypothetical protein [Myxococcales bacterium]